MTQALRHFIGPGHVAQEWKPSRYRDVIRDAGNYDGRHRPNRWDSEGTYVEREE